MMLLTTGKSFGRAEIGDISEAALRLPVVDETFVVADVSADIFSGMLEVESFAFLRTDVESGTFSSVLLYISVASASKISPVCTVTDSDLAGKSSRDEGLVIKETCIVSVVGGRETVYVLVCTLVSIEVVRIDVFEDSIVIVCVLTGIDGVIVVYEVKIVVLSSS